MSEPIWLSFARSYIGQREVKGTKHNPLILKWWTAIRAPFTDDETPWCAGFVGGMFEASAIKSSRAASARSYLKWGVGLAKPSPGAVLVFERGPVNGHVGFYVSEDATAYHVLGGNQGDEVNISRIAKKRLIGIRWPAGITLPTTGPVTYKVAGGLSENEK
jgi:uncharacterized protein (TIGR02594 family)